MVTIRALGLAVFFVAVPALAYTHGRGGGGGGHSSGHSYGGRSYGSTHYSTSAAHSSTHERSTHTATTRSSSTTTHTKRDPAQRRAFQHSHACPSTGRTSGACPGYVVDHVQALKHGGADSPSNMQWQTTADAKAKDRVE